jgi:hypothetical protein
MLPFYQRSLLGALIAGAIACGSIRTTGPKTSYDHCVDRCDQMDNVCAHPMYPPSCGIEYDACLQRCEAADVAKAH